MATLSPTPVSQQHLRCCTRSHRRCVAAVTAPARPLQQVGERGGGSRWCRGGNRALVRAQQQPAQQQPAQQQQIDTQQQQQQPDTQPQEPAPPTPPSQQQAEPELPDLAQPKFQPFTPLNALRQAMLGFRRSQHLPDGRELVVVPLAPQWLPAAADLLTDSFAESLAAAPFKRYLRRQVKAYLESHIGLPPKAVILAALLLPAASAASAAGSSSEQQHGQEAAATSSSNGGVASSSDGSLDSAATALDLGLWDGMGMTPLMGGGLDSLASSSGGSSSSDDDDAVAAAAMAAAVAAGAGSAGAGSGIELVAVVELSFSASTRNKYLTLTPPEDHCYLCNMATDAAHRGRGYGLALLQAAEALVGELGEREIYLHLRVQDAPAARLYQKAGYAQVAADNFLIRLLGQDQRRLMRKVLPK